MDKGVITSVYKFISVATLFSKYFHVFLHDEKCHYICTGGTYTLQDEVNPVLPV